MLLHFGAAANELDNTPSEEAEQLFSELIRTSILGFHYVVIERATCDWALSHLNLGGRDTAHLTHLRQTFTQRGALQNIAGCHLNIVLGAPGLEVLGEGSYRLGHRALLAGSYLDPAVLLVENSAQDGRLFEHALRTTSNGPVELNYQVRHGGGSTIVNCFKQEVQGRRIVVCVADSDRRSPADNLSNTARLLRDRASADAFIGKVMFTECREIENLIPLNLIREFDLCPNYPDYARLDVLINSERPAHIFDHLWLYFDVKNGVNGGNLSARLQNNIDREWYKDRFQVSDIIEISISGFGPNILNQFLASGAALARFHTHMRSEFWRLRYGEFFNQIAWFFAGERRRFAG